MKQFKSLFGDSQPKNVGQQGPLGLCESQRYVTLKTQCDQPLNIPTFGT